jgi:uncharacterized protein YxeA
MNKKGQGLPLNTIIIAIIVLVVLVVIVAIFVRQTGDFEQDVGREGNLELIKMKVSYGACKPSVESETNFVEKFNVESDAFARGQLKEQFASLIDECKKRTTSCDGSPVGNFGSLTATCSR